MVGQSKLTPKPKPGHSKKPIDLLAGDVVDTVGTDTLAVQIRMLQARLVRGTATLMDQSRHVSPVEVLECLLQLQRLVERVEKSTGCVVGVEEAEPDLEPITIHSPEQPQRQIVRVNDCSGD